MAYLAMALVDIAVMCVFGFLAFHFNKWWIVLFSIFYFVTAKESRNKKDEEDINDDGKSSN